MKPWKIAIARDTAVPSLGLHGLHVACNGLPNVEVVGFFDSKADDLATVMAVTGARRHYRDYVHMLYTEKPDIVILCSRHPNDHFPQIAAAAERGLHIYCEKMIYAVYSSHLTGRVVHIPLADRTHPLVRK